jgi:hypothetical protein
MTEPGPTADSRTNALAYAEDAFVTISTLRAGDNQRSQSKKERPSFVRLAATPVCSITSILRCPALMPASRISIGAGSPRSMAIAEWCAPA